MYLYLLWFFLRCFESRLSLFTTFIKMGATSSSSKVGKDKKIGEILRRKARANRSILKILLLGAGESGKSTGTCAASSFVMVLMFCSVFKQMALLKGEGFTKAYFLAMKSKLCGNVVDGTYHVIK